MGSRPLVALVLALALGAGPLACEETIDAALLRQWDQTDDALLTDGALHVVLVGTGVPIPDAERLPACTAVVADGQLVLVDAGPGTIRQADLLELPIQKLSAILVTHFHSDHIGGLGEALASSWFRGRENVVRIYGPPGLRRVVEGFAQVYAFDTRYRRLPGGDELEPRWMEPEVHEVTAEGESSVPVFERGDLRVEAFAVDHSPVAPAYGYRLEHRGRVVVLSGDTRLYPPLARHARGADLLIHAAGANMPGFLEAAVVRLQERGELPRVDRDLLPTPVEVAEIARRAEVDTLVFSHILPINNFLLRWYWLRGVDDVYGGEVVVGEDGMRFDLEARPDGSG